MDECLQQPTGAAGDNRQDGHPRSKAKNRPLSNMRQLVCRPNIGTTIGTDCMRIMQVVVPADLTFSKSMQIVHRCVVTASQVFVIICHRRCNGEPLLACPTHTVICAIQVRILKKIIPHSTVYISTGEEGVSIRDPTAAQISSYLNNTLGEAPRPAWGCPGGWGTYLSSALATHAQGFKLSFHLNLMHAGSCRRLSMLIC